MAIDWISEVKSRDGAICDVLNVEVRNRYTLETVTIPFDKFIEAYEEYIDPRDLEIEKLNKLIKELQEEKKAQKKPRRRLTKEEWKEIDELIRKGIRNIDIAAEYGISDTGVSKRRTDLRKAGEAV